MNALPSRASSHAVQPWLVQRLLTALVAALAGWPLAQAADVTFLSLTDEVNYRSEGMYSLISQLAILDTLFMMTVLRVSSRTGNVMTKVHDVIEQTRHDS